MNPLIKKEIRLLLPAWIAAMLLAIVPAWIWHLFWTANAGQDNWMSFDNLLSLYVPLLVVFGTLCLGIASFGQEFSSNTFTVLLSQPTERRRIWAVKSVLLAIAFTSVWLVAVVIISRQFDILNAAQLSFLKLEGTRHYVQSGKLDALAFLTASALAVCSGGLWTTLLLRQITGAFWITLLAPVAINGGVGIILGFFPISDDTIDGISTLVLLGYSIAGFIWARRLFFRAQDAQWTGGNFIFPWQGRNVGFTGSLVQLPRHGLLALAWKEIRLQEVNLFIAAVLLAIHLTAVIAHPMVTNRNTKMILELVWSLWLAMPLLIGSSAIAEERKLGILASQLCLPVSRSTQFSIKFFVALVLSVVLGAVMPSVIQGPQNFDVSLPPHWIYLMATAIFFISFYASTLSHSTLQAMGVAIVIPAVAWFGFTGFCVLAYHATWLGNQNYFGGYEVICRIWLMVGSCALVFPFLLARLMFRNFRWLQQSGKMVRFNLASLLITFGVVYVLTNTIYFRPWELLSPIEPPHGPARLGAGAVANFMTIRDPMRMAAVLPNGQLWEENLDDNAHDYKSFYFERWSPGLYTQRFVDGTNWAEIVPNSLYVLGLKRDGTLWCIPQFGNSRGRVKQIGSDTDWLNLGPAGSGFVFLKKNGTLWLWGTNEVSYASAGEPRYAAKIKADLATLPTCVSTETDWTNLIPFAYYHNLVQKNDGTLWMLERKWRLDNTYEGTFLVRQTNLDNQWSSYAYNWSYSAEIKTNGELWLFQNRPAKWNGDDIPPYGEKTKVDSEHVWKEVSYADYGESLVLLRQDGTLWKWDSWQNKTFNPIQLGHNSDWVGLPDYNWMGMALAADGSLWSWTDGSDHLWLAPSRRPVYMGNIFDGAGAKE